MSRTRSGCLKRPWVRGADPKGHDPSRWGSQGQSETHSQTPIKDCKKFLFEEVKFNEADTTDAGKLGIGGKGVAEGF
jgi:hypothetical protein